MRFTTTNITGTYEILAADDFTAVPIKVAGNNVVKAGSPLTAAGAVDATGANAAGILLYDVNPAANPNGALVVKGVIDLVKCKAVSGLSGITAADLQTAVPGIVCRENIGVNE